MTETYITIKELSELAHYAPTYLTRLIKQGRLPAGQKVWKTRKVPKIKALLALSKINRRASKSTLSEEQFKIKTLEI